MFLYDAFLPGHGIIILLLLYYYYYYCLYYKYVAISLTCPNQALTSASLRPLLTITQLLTIVRLLNAITMLKM